MYRHFHGCKPLKMGAIRKPRFSDGDFEKAMDGFFKTLKRHDSAAKARLLLLRSLIECAAVHGCHAEPHRTLDSGSGACWTYMEYLDISPVAWPKRMVLAGALLLAVVSSNAADIDVTVLDRHGEAVSNVAVYIEPDQDGPLPAPTNSDGETILTADSPGGLTVSIWSPRIDLKHENLTQTIKAGRSARITFSLKEKLRAARGDESEASSWNEN